MPRKLALHLRLASGITRQVKGREAETLVALINAGSSGITSLEAFQAGWAARLAAYIHDLKKMGVPISMQREVHDGGQHGRYFLAGQVEIVWSNDRVAT
jgi:hypothetical protein